MTLRYRPGCALNALGALALALLMLFAGCADQTAAAERAEIGLSN